MTDHPTASSITDPQLDDLLAELRRLRTAVALHRPSLRDDGAGTATCIACAGRPWPCATAVAADPDLALIAEQSLDPPSHSGTSVIGRQSLPEKP